MLFVSAKETLGHRADFFRKAINIPENEETEKNHLQKESNLCPLNTLKFRNFKKCLLF